MSTLHIQAEPGDFATTVLMPGDPLRAQMIAETYLQDARQINSVRNMSAFTGLYKGCPVSVMGSGMGIASISIYAHELYAHFGVQRIIRVGSCGSVQPHIRIGDLVLALGASTDSGVNRKRLAGFDFAAVADYPLLASVMQTAQTLSLAVHVGNIFSADLFYEPAPVLFEQMRRLGILAVEMEAAGLYGVAAEHGRQAVALLTVSDHIFDGEKMSPEQRQNDFHPMALLALETAIRKH